jgi:hypothetical protein
MAVLEWPVLGVEFVTKIHRRKQGGLNEDRVEHRETICDGGSAETKGCHETGGKHGGAASVAETEQPLERSDELEAIRVWSDVSSKRLHFDLIEVLDED